MKRLAILIALTTPLWGGRSIGLPQALNGSAPSGMSGSAPASALSLGIEIRISDWSVQPGGQSAELFGFTNSFTIQWLGGTSRIRCQSPYDGGPNGSAVDFDVAGRSDFIVRFQRDIANARLTFELWSADGSGYSAQILPITSFAQRLDLSTIRLGKQHYIGTGPVNARIAFAKLYTSVLPMGEKPPHAVVRGGDVANYDFENGIRDTSGNNRNLSLSGSAIAYFDTDGSAMPFCSAGPQATFRAGATGRLDGSGSYALDESYSLTYTWQQISGPSRIQFTAGQLSQSPTVSGLVFGSYVFQLAVSDGSGKTSSCTVKHGAVATDSSGIVIIPNPSHAKFLGDIPRYGTNLWPWFDTQNKHIADAVNGSMNTRYAAYWDTPNAGTLTVTPNSNAVVGVGTTFDVTFCGGAGSTTPKPEASIIIWVPSKLYPGTYGRKMYYVTSCQDATHLTMRHPYWTTPYVDAGSGLNYTYSDNALYSGYGFGPAPGNYYDNVMGFYSLYYRTGIDDYLLAARTLADRWWTFFQISRGEHYDGDSGGWTFAEPRSMALAGLMMRAVDGRPDMWIGLRVFINYLSGFVMPVGPVADLRNHGYIMVWLSMAAIFDPDPAQRNLNIQRIETSMNNHWTPYRQPDGSWLGSSNSPGNMDSGTGKYYNGKLSVTAGTTSVVGIGTNLTVLDGNNNGCRPGAKIWFTSANSIWNSSGGNSGDPVAYDIVARPDDTHLTLGTPYNGLTGVKNFQCQGFLGPGIQPMMLGIAATGFRWAYEALSTDPTKIRLAAAAKQYAIGAANWIGTYGRYAPYKATYTGRTFVDCLGPTDCLESDASAAREYNAEAINAMVASYRLQPDSAIKSLGDEMMSSMYSKVGSGPDTDGTYVTSLEDNGLKLLMPTGWPWKWFGYFFGFGANWAWPGVRLGGLSEEQIQTVPVSFNLADVANATAVRMKITKPDGSQSEVVCSSSPCEVPVDVRQLDHLIQIEYLSGSSQVMATSSKEPLWIE